MKALSFLKRGFSLAGLALFTKRRGRTKLYRKGFTLIELLIVMAIISTLSTIGFVYYRGFIEQTKNTKAISDIHELANLIEQFKEDNGRYPGNLDELGRGPLKDPWGNPYHYVNISEDAKRGASHQNARWDRNQRPINTYYDLWSNGADGKSQKQVVAAHSRDDIIRAWDGAFVGLGKELDDLYGKPRPWKHSTDDTPDPPGAGEHGPGQGHGPPQVRP